jgi:hypothetical protein
VDGDGGTSSELLEDDRSDEGTEGPVGITGTMADRAGGRDEAGKDGIDAGDSLDGRSESDARHARAR